MGKEKKGNDRNQIIPDNGPGENEKQLRRLEIQKDVLKKIIDPLSEQIKNDELKEYTTSKMKKRF